MITSYTKIMFVRHPLERFKNKFMEDTQEADVFRGFYARRIMSIHQRVPIEEINEEGIGLTFLNFLKFLSLVRNSF